MMSTLTRIIMAVTYSLALVTWNVNAQIPLTNHHVSTLYLVPSDYNFSQAEYNTIISAMQEVQAWYQVATGGKTFTLENDGVPTVINLANNAAYYETNYWGNILDELVTLGINNWEEGEIKMMFLRAGGGLAGAAQGCLGECGVGMIGMDLWPEYNSGQFIDCPGGQGGAAWPCTPMGATVHELGHALGLPHPDANGYPFSEASHSVMQTHWNYPYIYAPQNESPWSLLPYERLHLRNSPFFDFVDLSIPQPYEAIPVCNVSGSGPVPVASFTYEVDGTEVTFSNTSTGANLYYWTFDDGGAVSTEEDPVFEFSDYGVYTVRLRASGSNSMMAMAEVEVAVCNLSTSIEANSDELCAGESVTITADGGSSYLWNSGAASASITVEVFEPEEFTVTISDASGCFAEESIYISTLPAPDPYILTSTNEEYVCQGEEIELYAADGDEFEWSTGDDTESIIVMPTATTTYEVTVTNDFGCSNAAAITIEVLAVPNATLTATAVAICQHDTTVLTASGGGSYLWNTGSVQAQISVSPLDTTEYFVTVSNGGLCADITSIEILVWPVPNAGIQADSIVCSGDSIQISGSGEGDYVWSTGDTLNVISALIQADSAFSVSVTNEFGCRDDAEATVLVYAHPEAIQSSADSVCVSDVVTLTGPPAVDYLWSTGDTTSAIIHTYTDALPVSLIVIDSNQCTYPLAANVYVRPFVQASVEGPNVVCGGDTITLTIAPSYAAYNWSSGCTGPACEIWLADSVYVAITDSMGCLQTVSHVVQGDDTEGLAISGSASICEGDTAVLSIPPGYISTVWSTGDTSLSIVVTTAGLYSVEVVGSSGCHRTVSSTLGVTALPAFTLTQNELTVTPAGLDTLTVYSYLWSDGSTGSALQVTESGTYCLTVTDGNGCNTMHCLEVIITSTDDLSGLFRVFPNPTSNEFYIESAHISYDILGIFDLMCRPVPFAMVDAGVQKRITLEGVPSGLYVLLLSTKEGRMAQVRVMKE